MTDSCCLTRETEERIRHSSVTDQTRQQKSRSPGVTLTHRPGGWVGGRGRGQEERKGKERRREERRGKEKGGEEESRGEERRGKEKGGEEESRGEERRVEEKMMGRGDLGPPGDPAVLYIDECFDGFVECDDKAICVNLPGWYHCECRDGYHDNGLFSTNGESCIDINECKTGRNTCANDTVCFNLEGGYDCRCPHGRNCTGDCIHDNKIKHSRQIWVLDNDRCSVCSCQTGQVMCRRMVCDCENPTADLFCCPECDPRLSSQCLHQNGLLTYGSGDTWVENCQQCQYCWPLSCPHLDCEFTVVPKGECCARCVTDPCQADTIRNDITKTCMDEHGIQRFSGSSWVKHGTECTLCQCKNGHICCSVDPMCL
ncbi:unnamed protein product [Coregonus sp. 'balchen']|nr:unnamed protein product [Coregonus sp. 'balchen']